MSELERLAAEYRRALAWFTSCQRACIAAQEARRLAVVDARLDLVACRLYFEADRRFDEARRVEGAAHGAFQDAEGRLLACARKEP